MASERYPLDDDADPETESDEYTSMFGPRAGVWALSSVSDSRWNVSGRSGHITVTDMTHEAKAALHDMTEKYGPPPEDLEYFCVKD